ncbi:polysaccharide deacetylase family protein [Altererythrobacter salegens]|uniref:Chitooligosaccharide deacetylase n=1 Tax=Croceibacterium salegens TaxID=1737568 RepID=A0A6I4SXB9_9SPHN|nr:polysaccharide deacetylase family protein [Croceibacterium salegens]MXO60734.1 polysaccharide deacetylase family protein [Croceibacterium salegens]
MVDAERLPVLTFHSISEAAGPTSIPPGTFAMQMQALADAGFTSCTMAEYAAWHAGQGNGERRLLITFDDAFCDFAEAAAPIMRRHGFAATVFVPTALVGSPEAWAGANSPARKLLDWDAIRALQAEGFEFGSHSRTHAYLPKLPQQERECEIADSAAELSAATGRPAEAFAAPYGAVDAETVALIARHYPIAFGTRFDVSRREEARHDIPRLDMHYFRSEATWRGFLAGDRGYFTVRRALRAVRGAARKLAA